MSDPLSTAPSTDAGSETLARFHYQALITVPFCLECALGGDILSVVPEHHEDVALECNGPWRFIQIKSRDPERGLWRLSDLLGRGGALRSLHRTHNATREVEVSLELLLEGATHANDPIEHLKGAGDRRHPDLVSRVSAALRLTGSETIEFLDRVTLDPHPAPRPSARAQNILLIQQHGPALAAGHTHSIHDQLVAEIERAMRAEAIGPSWPRYVIRPTSGRREARLRLEAKRLTRELLRRIVQPLSVPLRPLLRRLTAADSETVSPLEQKLVAGGAPESLIIQARRLRANTQVRWLETRSSELLGDQDLVDDFELRLETYATAKREACLGDAVPAPRIWNELLGELTQHPTAVDPNSLLAADPLFLLGYACELSNRCVFDWGVARG